MGPLVIIGLVLAFLTSVAAFIFVVPEKRIEPFASNGFFKFLHDLFNFKQLLIEKIMKFLYILATFACIFVGFLLIFNRHVGAAGLIIMIAGPILVRIIYEFIMMAIIAVNNIVQINNKLGGQPKTEAGGNGGDYNGGSYGGNGSDYNGGSYGGNGGGYNGGSYNN